MVPKYLTSVLFSMVLWVVAGFPGPREISITVEAAEPGRVMSVMTYNLRYASAKPPNSWPERRPVMKALLREHSPDVIGTQEGVYAQLKDLLSDLPEYDWVGLGRDGGSRGEFMAVLFKRDRFEPLEFDHYWLSDTPLIMGSTTWGNTNRRMVTWVLFKDKADGRRFYFINTHFDHQIQAAREKSARMVLERAKLLPEKVPTLLVGDFNAEAKANPAYDILVGDQSFEDSWYAAAQRRNEDSNSFNNFDLNAPRQGKRIDWILFRGKVLVEMSEVIDFSQKGQLPSDHNAIVARIRFGD